jgi:hypothetical protein
VNVLGDGSYSGPLTWFCVCDLPGGTLPEWMRMVACAADGTIYVPAAVAGDEDMISQLAANDDAWGIVCRGHAYVPMNWLALRCPGLNAVHTRCGRD